MSAGALIDGCVSVVIPAYNAAWCVQRAVDSVLQQSWDNYEILVVNDGSTDETLEVLAAYGDRIRVLSKENGGLSSARNHGIEHARGEFIAYLDADDWWLEDKLRLQVELMQQNPALGFCSTRALTQTPEGQSLNDWQCPCYQGELLQHLFYVNGAIPGSGSGILVRTDLQRRVGGFDQALRSLEDIDMWMRLLAKSEYACVDQAQTVILKHSDSMSGNLLVMRASAIEVMRKHRPLLPNEQQGRWWRDAYANVLADYAKWAYRKGMKAAAIKDVLTCLAYSPFKSGKFFLGLLLAMLLGQKL